jgi:hypothetical protein
MEGFFAKRLMEDPNHGTLAYLLLGIDFEYFLLFKIIISKNLESIIFSFCFLLVL